MRVGVVTKLLPAGLNRDHPAGGEHDPCSETAKQQATSIPGTSSRRHNPAFELIRGIVQSNHKLVDALEWLWFSYKGVFGWEVR
jgi:hypothetical protein